MAESGSGPRSEGDLPTDEVILQTVYDQAASLDLCNGFYQPEIA